MIVSADDFSAYQSLVKLCGVYDLKLSPSGGTGERMWPSGKALGSRYVSTEERVTEVRGVFEATR